MPAKKPAQPTKLAKPKDAQLHIRVPARLLPLYEEWAADITEAGPIDIDRPTLIRLALEWTAVQRPTIAELVAMKKERP